jgi:hypothetical protein
MGTKIVIGALSGLQHDARRRRCRETWLADSRRLGVNAVFLIGAKEYTSSPFCLGDLLLLPCPNDYPSLPQRTRWFCRWALEQNEWDYLFKCDDDTYVSIERLKEYDFNGRDYIGGEWTAGVGYASGGAGYFLSRRAAGIVAETLTAELGDEDVLVGRAMEAAGIKFYSDDRFVGYGNYDKRPRACNSTITTHSISADIFYQSHREAGGIWAFRIVIPTCNSYAQTVVPATLDLLRAYWPDHPPVDVVHFEIAPPEREAVTRLHLGPQAKFTWPAALVNYLSLYNSDQLVLLMLDDYGLCQPAKRQAIREAQNAMLADPTIGNVHLTWQPANPKTIMNRLLRLPPWTYSVNTQAALWRRDLLLQAAMENVEEAIDQFELAGSVWFNNCRAKIDMHCQVPMPEPENPSAFVDEMDKTHWALGYRNLMRRGSPDPRHAAFLQSQGVSIPIY